MDSLSYRFGRLFAKFAKSGGLLMFALLLFVLSVSGYLSTPSSKPASGPMAAVFDLQKACAGERSQKYQELMDKKSYWLASLQMTACGTLGSHPEYKKMEMAAELLHYQEELAASGRDKTRKMAAVNSMISRGHPVSHALAVEFRKYEEVEMARAKAAEARLRKSQGVTIGMTYEEVLASSWGRPKRVNKTTRATSESQQWVYDGGYLYFENGVLRTIQH
jgi:hypothetical protein